MFVTLYGTGEVQFCLSNTNGFHVKAENEKFIAVTLRCRQNIKKGALAMTTATARKTAPENKYLRNCDYLRLSHLVRIL